MTTPIQITLEDGCRAILDVNLIDSIQESRPPAKGTALSDPFAEPTVNVSYQGRSYRVKESFNELQEIIEKTLCPKI